MGAAAWASGRLLDRDADLATLGRLMDDVAAGLARVALVEGPAGIGKTRLLGELRARWSAAGRAQVSARCGELERMFAFGVVRQLCSSGRWPTPGGGRPR